MAEMNAKDILTQTEIAFGNVESQVTVDTLLEISLKFSINFK
jgi:hypothetical protein